MSAERRLSNKRLPIIIDAEGKVWAPDDRKSSVSARTSPTFLEYSEDKTGIENPSYESGEIPMQEVHLGHSPHIRRKSLSYLRKELENDHHEVELEALFLRFNSHPTYGLTSEQVKLNLILGGKNELTPPRKEPHWVKFLKTLVGGFQLLLWIGSILCFTAYTTQLLAVGDPPLDNLGLGSVLALLAIVLGLFIFYQEYMCDKIMDTFSRMAPSLANVIRNGNLASINANELVVGDIIEIKGGDRIPADFRIIECQLFKVDNSSLTGESEPQSRTNFPTDENPMETRNLAFFSTNALEGTATGIVVCVGDSTVIGRIAGLTAGLDSSDTPLAREITRFVRLISALAIFFGILFFLISLSMGYTWIDSTLFLIGIIVANVPEGLLVTFTVILALTAKRMSKKNCLVRHLHAVETLGSTSVICSDKTGTLTQNKMTVCHLWFCGHIFSTDHQERNFEMDNPGFEALSRVAILCSRAKYVLTDQQDIPIKERKICGDASEAAILRCMEFYVGGIEDYRSKREKIFEIPFSSEYKWQLSIHDMKNPKEPRYLLVMKGAPERVLDYCHSIRMGNKVFDLDKELMDKVQDVCEQLAEKGERVLGFVECFLPNDKFPVGYEFTHENREFLAEHLTFVGLVSMADPPRPGVPAAVKTCRNAGIKVVMVTGDHPTTAKAIARSVGIISAGNETAEEIAKRLSISIEDVDPKSCSAIVVNGMQLMGMSTERLDEVLEWYNEIIFARVSPQQKLIIVEGYQRRGQIVAVTGDGVNDAPALKKADIGIAMGISGSDVSKQAADMILLDDDFTSIVTGIEEGRLIFENLKKCICYLLAANIAELTPFVLYFTFKIPLPMGTIPMLMICLGTDILPTISLSYEKAESDIMNRPPRNPNKDNLVTDKLISYSYGQLGLIESFAVLFTYFVVMGGNGFLPQDLIGIQPQWDSKAINDLKDHYGQEWTYDARKQLEHTCWTATFCTVVICQWGNVLISKKRRLPLYSKFFDNKIIFWAILGETALACFLTYTPGLNSSISFMPIKIWWWITAIPFCIFIICYDEMRRFLLRKITSWTWFQQEFYY